MSDTLTALRTALTPKQGMRRIPLSLESYRHQATQLSSKRLLNCFAEQEPADARTAAAILPVPGLTDFVAVGPGPIFAQNWDRPGAIYVISGTHLYLVNGSTLAVTDLGDVGTPSGGFSPDFLFYSIAVGTGGVAVVCSPPNAYVSVDGGPVALITTTWPSYGASSVAFFQGYYVFTGQTSPDTFFVSRLADPTMVDALDFASLDAFPNVIGRVMPLGDDLWFGGPTGWEVWYNAGNADFPFRRRPGGTLTQTGLGVAKTLDKWGNHLYFHGEDNIIYRSNGYTFERISTHAIEASLTTGLTTGYCYSQLGHVTYCLGRHGAPALCYDESTKVWHEASSSADGTGEWRPSCASKFGPTIFGDSIAGVLLLADPNVSTDRGIAVTRQVVLPPLYAGTNRAFCARLEIEMEVGGSYSPSDIVLDWSDDGGVTFTGGPRTMNVGSTLETRKRVYATRLGSFRNRVFRVTATHAFTIFAVDADITAGNH